MMFSACLSRIVAIASVLGFGLPLVAQESNRAQDPPPSTHHVIVPFAHDPDNPRTPSPDEARQYFLDYETFNRLWSLAKANRIRINSTDAAAGITEKDYIVTSALYRGDARKDRLEVEGRLTVHTRGKPWQKVPLPFSQVNISKIEIDGAPASYQGGAVLIENPGMHQITVNFEVPLVESTQSASWKVPSASATLLAMTMDSELAEPVINNGLPLVKSTAAGSTVFTAALGQATGIEFRRRLKTSGRGMTQPNVAFIDSHLFVTPALERLEAAFRLEFAGQEENSFSIAFDPSITPVRFEIPNLATWRMVEDGGQGLRVLEFELTQPVRDAVTVRMIGERLIEDIDEPRDFPALGANAMRLERFRSLLRSDELEIRTEPGSRHRQTDFRGEGVDTAGFLPVGTYALAGPEESLEYRLSEEAPERRATAEYVYQVSPGKLETIGQFQVRSPEAPLLNLSLTLPADATIQAIDGNRIKDWWRTGDELFVRFFGSTPDVTALLVYIAQELDTDVTDVSIGPFGMPGLEDDQVKGAGLVVAHVTQDTLLRFDQAQQVVREVGPEEAALDFEVLAPLVRKRGFRFERAVFSGNVSLAPVEPRFDAAWVMLAQVHESWLRLSVQADIEVTRSAVDRVVFSTEESVPEWRVLSPDVREIRTTVADGRREYTVIFQRHVTDAIDFTLETEIPHGGSADLPDVHFADATRQERYVVVENQGADRIDLDPSGLDPTVKDLLPFAPDTLKSAQLFRARPDWSGTVSVEKLETTAGNEAVVLYAELSTAFRANGEEWVKAVYHLQNRSLQFLPVALPENAELVAVSVAGQEVRADKGEIDSRNVVLVPLIQTKPGQLAYDVEIIFRSRDEGVRTDRRLKSIRRTLDDPEIVGLGVERTLWNVFLPAEHQLTDVDGNMDRVTATANVVEKLQADLSELEQLNNLGASDRVDLETLMLSCSNGSLIASRIEGGLNQLDQFGAPVGGEIRQKLEAQKVILTENRIKIPEFSQRTTVQVGGGFQGRNVEGDQVMWADNSGKIVSRNTAIEKKNLEQRQRVEKQVRLNDNVSIGNDFFNPDALMSRDADGEKTVEDARKAEVQLRAQLGKLSEADEVMAVEEKLKALNFQQIGHGGKDEDGKPMDQADFDNYIDFGKKAAKAPAKPKSKSQVAADQEGNRFLGQNARQQLERQPDVQTAMPQIERMAQQPSAAPNAFPATPATPVPTQMAGGAQTQEAVPVLGDLPAVGRLFGGGGMGGGAAFDDLGEVFRAGGRRSVSVDFPVEGAVYHFQKLKDHAELHLASAKPADLERGKWFLVFLLCACLLFLGKRLTRRFIRRAAG